MSTQHISRAQWAQIEKRARKANFAFDPKWKCLIDGKDWGRAGCDHTEEDQHVILAELREKTK